MKKQKGKGQKAGGSKNKDEPSEAREDTEQEQDASQQRSQPTEDKAEASTEEQTHDQPETPAKPQHDRQPSLSLQSKMRSSSFRRTSVSQGPLSPNGTKSPELPLLSPDSDSVNSIYRKQAARLDELEKENRRLAKDAQEAEKRRRHTEEELEELREASAEVAELKSRAQKAEAQIEELNKLVRYWLTIASTFYTELIVAYRNKRTSPSNAKILNFNPNPPNATSPPLAKQMHPRALYPPFKHNSTQKVQPLNPWKWKSPTSAPNSTSPHPPPSHIQSKSPLSKISLRGPSAQLAPPSASSPMRRRAWRGQVRRR